MSDMTPGAWEATVRRMAAELPYPPTPNVAVVVAARLRRPPVRARQMPRLAWALAVLAVALAALLSVPQVRAAVVDILRVGVVTIFLAPPSATPATLPTPTALATATGRPPAPNPLVRLAGEVTLEEARASSDLPIPLPGRPADLGPPDHVYLQDQNGPVVMLVWLEPDDPNQVRLSLHILAANTWGVGKFEPVAVEETQVNGHRAVWTVGPYMMQVTNAQGPVEVRLIEGHVLIWADGDVTYRLETNLTLVEAVQIAESLD